MMTDKTKEHKKLASTIKGVHKSLRRKFRESKNQDDFESLWANHTQDAETLKSYADAMKSLASDHWTSSPESRIEWCYQVMKEYYLEDGMRKAMQKDAKHRYFERLRHQQVLKEKHTAISPSDIAQDTQHSVTVVSEAEKDINDAANEISDKIPSLSVRLEAGLITAGSEVDALGDRIFHRKKQVTTSINEASCESSSYQGINLNNKDQGDDCSVMTTRQKPDLIGQTVSSDMEQMDTCDECCKDICYNVKDFQRLSINNQTEIQTVACSSESDQRIAKQPPSTNETTAPPFDEMKQSSCGDVSTHQFDVPHDCYKGPIKLLDVGSCYNPFAAYHDLRPLAIDICPGDDSVRQCDFLHLSIHHPNTWAHKMDSNNGGVKVEQMFKPLPPDTSKDGSRPHQDQNDSSTPIHCLPSCSFDTVVFCLLLEYLPSPRLRFRCCVNATRLLHLNGLLLIVTPDSKSHNKNAPMMRSWRNALSRLGLVRWKYLKLQHMHCMAYRKISVFNIEELSAVEAELSHMMYIPQDFNDACYHHDDPVSKKRNRRDRGNVLEQNESDEEICMDMLFM